MKMAKALLLNKIRREKDDFPTMKIIPTGVCDIKKSNRPRHLPYALKSELNTYVTELNKLKNNDNHNNSKAAAGQKRISIIIKNYQGRTTEHYVCRITCETVISESLNFKIFCTIKKLQLEAVFILN